MEGEPKFMVSQIEIAFDISRISSDQTKFRYTIINLDQTVLPSVSDIISNPPETGKYDVLKRRIISSFDESTESKLRKLLSGNEMPDEKPSNILQRLKNLAGGMCNENTIKTIFMEQLRDQVRAILAICDDPDLPKLALQADKIVEVSKSTVSAINITENSKNENQLDKSYENQLKELREMIEVLSIKIKNRYRGRSRSNFRNRFRNRSRSRNENSTFCYYHRKFREQAYKCQTPCSWTGKDKRKEQNISEN